MHRRQVSEMNLNCCGANLPWQLVHFLNDDGILVLIFVLIPVVANSNLSPKYKVLIVMRFNLYSFIVHTDTQGFDSISRCEVSIHRLQSRWRGPEETFVQQY